MLRILLCGDTHCGDKAGLTPPDYWQASGPFRALQMQLWNWWEKTVNSFGTFDMTGYTGDMVEGEGKKGTIDLFETDTETQAKIAAEAMSVIPCKKEKMFAVYGTPFHTAGTYSYENHFAEKLGITKPKTIQRLNIDNLIRLNIKHTVQRSSIPYGQGTPTYKEMVNEILNAALQEDQSADVCVRGHAHYSVSMRVRDKESIVVPCLKYPESIFGRRMAEGQYDMGFGVLEVYGHKDWRYIPIHLPLPQSSRREWTDVEITGRE